MSIKGFRVKSHLEIETRNTPPEDPIHGSIYVDKNGIFYIYINGAWRELITNNTNQILSNKIIDKSCKIEVDDINCVNLNIDGYINGVGIENILNNINNTHSHNNKILLDIINQDLSTNSSPEFNNIYIKNNIIIDGYINNVDVVRLNEDFNNHINSDIHNLYIKDCDEDVDVLDVVYLNSNILRKASAININTAIPFGVVIKKINNTRCVVKTRGIIGGYNNLISNKNIILSREYGKIMQSTDGLKAGECIVVLGKAISQTEIFFDNYLLTILSKDR